MIHLQFIVIFLAYHICVDSFSFGTLLKSSQSKKSNFLKPTLPPQTNELKEVASKNLIENLYSVPIICPKDLSPDPIYSTFAFFESANVETENKDFAKSPLKIFKSSSQNKKKATPIVLLHGFDSSSLEFRRIAPLLNTKQDVYAIDILGWGFIEQMNLKNFGPDEKMEHLRCFIRQVLDGKKCNIIGASLGGALAIKLAAESPELVEKMVLIDAQGFIDGKGPSDIPDTLAKFGVNILKSWPLRMYANFIAYSNISFATWEAMLTGRLHCYMPSWENASVSFLKSGGFVMSELVPKIKQSTLVIWGAQDKILDPSTALRFQESLPVNTIKIIENCGHVPHLEKPEITAQEILNFLDIN